MNKICFLEVDLNQCHSITTPRINLSQEEKKEILLSLLILFVIMLYRLDCFFSSFFSNQILFRFSFHQNSKSKMQNFVLSDVGTIKCRSRANELNEKQTMIGSQKEKER